MPRQVVFAAVALLAVIVSAWAGYSWFAGGPRVSSPQKPTSASVSETEEQVAPRAVSPANGAKPTSGAVPSAVEAGWTIAVASTHDTNDASNVLGPPDGRNATIFPGGELTLLVAGGKYIYNGPGPDLRVQGPAGARIPYTILAKTDDDGIWVRFDRNTHGFPGGEAVHDFGHHGLDRIRQIMIRNDGADALSIDAVVAVYTQPVEAVAHDETGDHHAHRGR